MLSKKELPPVNLSMTARELPDLMIKKHMDVRDILNKHKTSRKRGISTGVNKANGELAAQILTFQEQTERQEMDSPGVDPQNSNQLIEEKMQKTVKDFILVKAQL